MSMCQVHAGSSARVGDCAHSWKPRYNEPWSSKGTTEQLHEVRGQTLPHVVYSEAAEPALLLPTFPFPMSLWRQLVRLGPSWAFGEVLSPCWDAMSSPPVGCFFLPKAKRGSSKGKLVRVAGYPEEGGMRIFLPCRKLAEMQQPAAQSDARENVWEGVTCSRWSSRHSGHGKWCRVWWGDFWGERCLLE